MKRPFKSLLSLAAAMVGFGSASTAVAMANNVIDTANKSAEEFKETLAAASALPADIPAVPKPTFLYKQSSGVIPARLLNQRQYRKRCAQNPWLRKSKKHRSGK
jgi:hypothetical protein